MKNVILGIQSFFNDFDDRIKKERNVRELNNIQNPIFIIGAPRSGSTFLYQEIIKHCKVIYISNIMALFPKYIILISKLTKHFILNYKEIKKSKYGFIRGINSPNEAGAIFRKWFDSDIDEVNKKNIINTIYHLSLLTGCPLLSKNLYNSLRLDTIYNMFPNAKFIFIRRNPQFVAQSLLLARRALNTNEMEWFGIAPKNYEKQLSKSVYDQIFWQISTIENEINNFLTKKKPKYITINYEELCNSLHSSINNISKKLDIELKDGKEFNNCDFSNKKKIDINEWNILNDYYEKYYLKSL